MKPIFYILEKDNKLSIQFGPSEEEIETYPLTMDRLEWCKKRIFEIDPSIRVHIPNGLEIHCK